MSPPVHDSTSPLLQLPNTYRAFYGPFPYLYPIQRRAIGPLLEGKDLIVQSATGSGKTEAVLAPCIERVIQSGREQAVFYVVPTRALAVDLERRLAPVLAERLGLRMGVRTGDLKRAGGARPDLLLTTPESLDVTLGSSNADLRGFVQRVGTVIIDEVHPLIYRYRGRQLAYLLQRLERRMAGPVQKVALSATIADVDAVIQFFGFRADAVRLIEPVQREIAPHFVHLKNDEDELVALLDDLYDVWDYRKVLMFANSRSYCDRLFSLLNYHGRFQGVTELHYSNLKSKERLGVEQRFRRSGHALCIATSTLELGIDIGDVDGVLLYEPPDSASAFLQRIGRSNRREGCTHFWGICRGQESEAQLFQFLGLLRLAGQGMVESPQPRDLPSVLVQQILSCLYEKKRISLAALQTLFPVHREAIDQLFVAMTRQGWLREDRTVGLFRGGWRYRDCFLERRIWSNFPEAEEDYTLELSGEAIADLPKSVVRQLELGDRVQLAGKRLQVLKIEAGERRHVMARSVDQLDDKELFWLGAGFRVSYEVAQAIREVFQAGVEAQTPGLFARTRRLLETALDRAGRRVVLDNGIEVGRGPGGLYRYRTYLGSVGNLVLQRTVEQDLSPRLEDLTVASDEVGIDCSHRIDFQTLSLPTDQEAFCRWTERHLEALCGLFPLNAFCAVLPRALLVEELTDFLFDCRVAEVFLHYLNRSSEVVSGDPAVLEQEVQESERRTPVLFDTAPGVDSLLTWEKRRWGIATEQDVFESGPDVRHRLRTLTGTMVGAYLRHQQCERWLSLNFMPPDQRPPGWREGDTDLGALRMERGRLHERQVLDHIRDRGEALSVVEEIDADGRRRSLKARFEVSLERLTDFVRKVESEPDRSFVLSQAVLILPSVLGREDDWLCRVDGVGIPDLIRVSMGDRGPLVEVGDIKDSRAPYDSQRWQVAFYTLLLKDLIRRGMLPVQTQVATSGFLMLRPRLRTKAPEQHLFDLRPYIAAFPMLFRNVGRVLLKAPSEATYRLQTHCTTCPNFEHCYREALQIEDVLFLPQVTAGALQKFRELELRTTEAAGAWFERTSREPVEEGLFRPHQRELLEGRLTALRTNRIGLRERKTRLFPHNLSTALFIHLIEDPISGLPRGVGWRALRKGGVVDGHTRVVASEGELPEVLQAFTERFLKVWEEGVEGGQGPHIFHFGERCWQALQVWGEETELAFLWAPERIHRTDLRRLVAAHFNFPAPGNLTLFALGRLLGLKSELGEPESLFHADDSLSVLPEEWVKDKDKRKEMAERIDAILALQIGAWQWASSHLESEWEQRGWDVTPDVTCAPETPYLNFLEEEKRLREEDILTLQAYTLEERVERFRAIGPLTFQKTALDDEGRFLYGFQTAPEAGLSKFREGDFLKLAPVGTPDLQSGFPVILAVYDRNAGRLWVHSRRGRLALNRGLAYSLEEDLADWNGPKLVHAVRTVLSADRPHRLSKLFSEGWPIDEEPEGLRWVQNWLRTFGPISGLNPTQQQALAHPFRYRLSLIEGPPGTGKTHLLGWTLIALIQQARAMGAPLRIAVSALTHQAIDQVLQKVATLVGQYHLQDFPGRCLKWGRFEGEGPAIEGEMHVERLDHVEALTEYPYLILGATGFGLYQLFEGRKGIFPPVFDWVVFDEASQVLIPQALLSLLYGKGNFLFSGDVKQLPPIVLGDYEEDAFGVHRSILSHLLDAYSPEHRVRLDRTYRMNEDLCDFPSRTWYDGALRAASGNAKRRLVLDRTRQDDLLDRVIDPEKPVSLLLVNHRGCHQKAELEAEIVAELAHRLMSEHGLSADQLALISPHRAQNNATADRLAKLLVGETLPLIDTVERVQGAERDVILFAFTTSDLDYVMSSFLNNPNRFNVAITRARQKLIVVGSRTFFSTVPQTEEALKANSCFKAFYEFCRKRNSLFFWE